MLGWILRRGLMTVTGIFRTLGSLADRHWTGYQKFFYWAAWSLNALSVALLAHVIYPMILEAGVRKEEIDFIIDSIDEALKIADDEVTE